MPNIYSILEELEIEYERHDHPPVYTCEEAKKHTSHLEGGVDKNLFLRNKKGDKHFLVSIEAHKRADLKAISKILGESSIGFASPERLLKYLGVTPGSVTPLGLINDENHEVHVIIDEDLIAHDRIQFHPLVNTSTLIIKREDLKKFLEWTTNPTQYIKL